MNSIPYLVRAGGQVYAVALGQYTQICSVRVRVRVRKKRILLTY
jgi:hypothetical protein